MADIFISYSSKDREKATKFAEQVRIRGYGIWMDTSSIEAASNWSTQITEALEACRVMILLLSQNSLASKNVANELSVAAQLGKAIIPIELEPVRLSGDFLYHLASIHRTTIEHHESIYATLDKLGIAKQAASEVATYSPAPAPPDPLGRKTLAVLPIEDLHPDPENEWFADGLTQEIINTLSQIERLRVKDRKSVKNYDASGKSAQQIAEELSVRYILEGTVRSMSGKFRLSVELIDTIDDDHLWSRTFNGTFEDLFDVQEKLANEIADALKISLTLEEKQSVGRTLTKNIEAYELYVEARDAVVDFSKEYYEHAEQLLKKAVELDPNFSEAWALLASVHIDLFTLMRRELTLLNLAEKEAQTALTLDSTSALATVLLGIIAAFRNDFTLAFKLAHNAVRLDRTDGMIYLWKAYVYILAKDNDRAVESAEEALRLNPDNLKLIWGLAYYMILANDRSNLRVHAERSLPYLERYLALNPFEQTMRAEYGLFLALTGRINEAVDIAQDILTNHYVNNPLRVCGIATIFYLADDLDRSLEAWARTEDLGAALYTILSPFYIRYRRHHSFIEISRKFKADAEYYLNQNNNG